MLTYDLLCTNFFSIFVDIRPFLRCFKNEWYVPNYVGKEKQNQLAKNLFNFCKNILKKDKLIKNTI